MYATGRLDAETSVPAIPQREHSVCSVIITIPNLMPGSCVCLTQKRTRRRAVIYSSFLISPALTSPTPHRVKVVNIEDVNVPRR